MSLQALMMFGIMPYYVVSLRLSKYHKQGALVPQLRLSGWPILQHEIPDELLNISSTGSADPRLLPLFTKMIKKEPVNILVFGGSVTAGYALKSCPGIPFSFRTAKRNGYETRGTPECSWTHQLENKLREKFHTDITIWNKAHGGTTVPGSASAIAMEITNFPGHIDAIMLEFLVNDIGQAKVSIALEKVIRTVSQILPDLPIIDLELACPECLTMQGNIHTAVLKHYGIPTVDYRSMVQEGDRTGQWQKLWWGRQMHPNVQTHGYIAEAIEHLLNKQYEELQIKNHEFVPYHEMEILHEQQDLDQFPMCVQSLSNYDVFESIENNVGLPDGMSTDGFILYEDRPGKPGWIANTTGATLKTLVKFGPQPTLILKYLRSYEGFGNATLQLHGTDWPLRGQWSAQNSQIYGLALQVAPPWLVDEEGKNGQAVWTKGFGVPPHSSLELTITNMESKFKLIQITTC